MKKQHLKISAFAILCSATLVGCGGGTVGTSGVASFAANGTANCTPTGSNSSKCTLGGTGSQGPATTPPTSISVPMTALTGAPSSPATSSAPTTALTTAPMPTSPTAPSLPTTLPVATPNDLCAGIPTFGKTLVNYSPLAKPAKGQTVTDPDFGAKITSITDVLGDWGAGVVIPAYPTAQAWNADETRLVLYVTDPRKTGAQTGYAMFDGKTYKFLKWLPINPADIEQFYWSKTDPTKLVYIDNREASGIIIMRMMSINVETGVQTVVHDFMPDIRNLGWPSTGPLRAGYPFSPGGNLELWGLGAGGIPNVNSQLGLNAFGFNSTTGKITLYKGIALAQARGTTPFPLKSGRGWGWPDWSNGTTKVFDLNGNVVRTVAFNSAEHLDSALNAAGDDLLVGTQYDGPSGSGNLMVANLTTGVVSTLIGQATGDGYPTTGALIGAEAYKNPGWVVEGITGDIHLTRTYLDQEILLANVDTKQICRIAHHRSTGYWANATTNNYWAQTNVTISPSGTRILVQSDWGAAKPGSGVVADPNAVIDTYVITLPSYKS